MDLIDTTGQSDLTFAILRQFGESTRRASAAALEAYAQVTERLGPEFAGVPSQEVYDRVFLPWAEGGPGDARSGRVADRPSHDPGDR